MKQLKQLKARLPIHPHLKKYIYWSLGIEYDTPIDMSQSNTIAHALRMYLVPKTLLAYNCHDGKYEQKYEETLTVLIDGHSRDRGCLFLDPKSFHAFNQYIREMFYDTLMLQVESMIERDRDYLEKFSDLLERVGYSRNHKLRPNTLRQKDAIEEIMVGMGMDVNEGNLLETVNRKHTDHRKKKHRNPLMRRKKSTKKLVFHGGNRPDLGTSEEMRLLASVS